MNPYDLIFMRFTDLNGEQFHFVRAPLRNNPASGWFELELDLMAEFDSSNRFYKVMFY